MRAVGSERTDGGSQEHQQCPLWAAAGQGWWPQMRFEERSLGEGVKEGIKTTGDMLQRGWGQGWMERPSP